MAHNYLKTENGEIVFFDDSEPSEVSSAHEKAIKNSRNQRRGLRAVAWKSYPTRPGWVQVVGESSKVR